MTRVKLCGLRRPQDAEYANLCSPEYAGFVFAPGKRQVTPGQAAELRRLLHPAIQTVGVFVNQPGEEIAALCKAGTIDMVQLHGDEDGAYIAALRELTDKPIIHVVPVGDRIPEMPEAADYVLFDTLSPARGGTGKAFDWRLLKDYKGPPCFLAGGLHQGNAAAAIAAAKPYCVDVSSGIETDGVKDKEKMVKFVEEVRRVKL